MTSLLVGGGAKCEASPNVRQRDAPDISGRLTSFSVEGEEEGRFRKVAGVPSLMRAVRVHGRYINGRQLSGLNNISTVG